MGPQASDAHGVLLIDTDSGVRWAVERGLTHSGYRVRTAHTVADAVRAIEQDQVTLVLMEVLPEAGYTLDTLSLFVRLGQSVSVVCSSLDASPKTAIECIRRGATGFLPKPFSLADIRAELADALRGRNHGAHRASASASVAGEGASSLIGSSVPMQHLRATIREVARTDLNCLIRGDSGVGKDVVAREIHRLSKRANHPFVKVNSSALPRHLLESEMFGFERGAFTGASEPKPGRFGLANKGIIFLDEIGELDPSLQAKLLQVIEHKEFTRLGSRKSTKVDVQVLAATNADIETKAKMGTFRQDLLFRLNEVSIWVPPLVQRKEDIPLLVTHFLSKHSRHIAGPPIDVTAQDIEALCNYDWPGNVRELESTIKRWLALGRKDLESLSSKPTANAVTSPPVRPRGIQVDAPAKDTDQEPSPERIRQVLLECQWNRRKAADVLGMSYQVLRRRIARHGLDQE